MKKIPHSRSIPERVQYGSLDKGVLPPAFETDHLTALVSRAKHRLSSYLYLFAIFRNSVVLSEGFPSPSGHRMLLTVISLDDVLEFWVPREKVQCNRQQTKAKLTRKTDCWVLFLCLSSLLCFLLSSFRSNHKNKYPQTVSESFELRNIRIRTQWKYFVASDADKTKLNAWYETRASVTRDGYRHGQYKRSTADCGLRTTDCGVGIKYGLGRARH